jgi:hypothetical protein
VGREVAVVSVVYEPFCRIIELLILRGRRDRSKDVEILWVPETRPGILSRRFALRDRIRRDAPPL